MSCLGEGKAVLWTWAGELLWSDGPRSCRQRSASPQAAQLWMDRLLTSSATVRNPRHVCWTSENTMGSIKLPVKSLCLIPVMHSEFNFSVITKIHKWKKLDINLTSYPQLLTYFPFFSAMRNRIHLTKRLISYFLTLLETGYIWTVMKSETFEFQSQANHLLMLEVSPKGYHQTWS